MPGAPKGGKFFAGVAAGTVEADVAENAALSAEIGAGNALGTCAAGGGGVAGGAMAAGADGLKIWVGGGAESGGVLAAACWPAIGLILME